MATFRATIFYCKNTGLSFKQLHTKEILEEVASIDATSSNKYQWFESLLYLVKHVRLERSLSSCEKGSRVSGFIRDDLADDITQRGIVVLAGNLGFVLQTDRGIVEQGVIVHRQVGIFLRQLSVCFLEGADIRGVAGEADHSGRVGLGGLELGLHFAFIELDEIAIVETGLDLIRGSLGIDIS